MKQETYSVATFKSLDSESIVVEGNLTYEQAQTLLSSLLNDNYGVEIISEDEDNMEPIVLIKTNSKIQPK
jgi:hypothetical protein